MFILFFIFLTSCTLFNHSEKYEFKEEDLHCPNIFPHVVMPALDQLNLNIRKFEVEVVRQESKQIGLLLQIDSLDQADFISYDICQLNTLFCNKGIMRSNKTYEYRLFNEMSIRFRSCVWTDRSFALDQSKVFKFQNLEEKFFVCGNEYEKIITIDDIKSNQVLVKIDGLRDRLHLEIYSFVSEIEKFYIENAGINYNSDLANSIEQVINLREIYHLIFETALPEYFHQYYIENLEEYSHPALCKFMTLKNLLSKIEKLEKIDSFYINFHDYANNPFLLLLLANVFASIDGERNLRSLIETLPMNTFFDHTLVNKDFSRQIIFPEPINFIDKLNDFFPGYSVRKLNGEQKALHNLYKILREHSKKIFNLYFDIKKTFLNFKN